MKEKLRLKSESIYEKMMNEEDARVCKAIDEKACKVVPGNFFLTIISYFFNKLADSVANTKVIIPWIMESLAVPLFLISFLVPIRESGSLLPQLLIAAYVRKLPIRKYIWSIGAFLQALTMIGIGIVAWNMQGLSAGIAIIFLIILFSLARGLSSVAAKDVLGKTIPKTRRGALNGYSGSLAGVLIIGLGVYFLFVGEKPFSPQNFGILLFCAGFFWIIAGLVYLKINEFEGETDGGGNAISVALKKISLLKTDESFRLFVISRALFLCSVLSAPFFVILAQQHSNSNNYLLGLFILASGLADFSLGFLVFILATFFENIFSIIWLMPLIYFVLTVGYQGIRIGRKTYLVDLAGGNKRTDYVAVSNSIIGFVLLFAGFIGFLSSLIGLNGIILLLSLIGVLGIFMALKLPDVTKE
ncbi:MFS transporter [Arcobacter peruensis]|uniref:MFS transporter n=1 Tax=Arcobacter peruensis TaxID=2320140 RepID=UPI000F08E859|nr:MFS transporter [Arcobacter peruensis]